MGKASEDQRRKVEWLKCKRSFAYFVDTYCKIYDATVGEWIPFKLWESQHQVCDDLQHYRLNIVLKARQLGMTWLVLCYILWNMLFSPIFTALVFSRRETEAIYLMGESRLRGIYSRLPEWMQSRRKITDSTLILQLSNGSVAYGFPTSAGDSYTASLAFVDEADLVPDLDRLMTAVKPTIDGGGQMVLLSRVDKETPNSPFKRMYLAAHAGKSPWHGIFLPWQARPGRDAQWYADQRADVMARTGSLDELYEQYPATPEEALKPPTQDRRLPYSWLKKRFVVEEPIEDGDMEVGVPGARVFRLPKYGEGFVISADPAEGNPESDDSAIHVMNEDTGEECLAYNEKTEPSTLAEYTDRLSELYNNAPILVERNNHGHAVLLALDVLDADVMVGWDERIGWMSSRRGKATMYSHTADRLRDGPCTIHDQQTFDQLVSIGSKDLCAPEGSPDDLATSFALSCSAIYLGGSTAELGSDPTKGHRG